MWVVLVCKQSCQSNVKFISCGTGAPDAQDKNYKSQDLLNNRSNHGHRLQEFCQGWG
ncbi:MAG: hypothetical protein IJE60_06400 [Tyzzerella sp.]|nr:hypothetical protein [Tyzzerella sp.]